MERTYSPPRWALTVAAIAIGAAASWVAKSPLGLLVPTAALFLFLRGRSAWLFYLVATGVLICALTVAALDLGAMGETAATWVAFFAAALCMGAIFTKVSAETLTADMPPGPEGNPLHAFVDVSADGAVHKQLPMELIHPEDRPAAAQAAAYAFWTGVPQIMSYRQRQADGSYRLTEFRAEPGYGVSVNVEAMVFKPDDRWTISDSFGESIEAVRAAKVIEALHGKAWAFNARGQFVYVTPAAQVAIGMTLEDLNAPVRGGDFIDGGDVGWSLAAHPEDYPRAAAGWRHSLKTGDYWNVEYRMLRATGQYIWHRISARPTRDSRGRITGWFGTSIDIDIYKKTEATLREREHDLTQLVNMVPSHVWRLTAEGEPTFFNKRMIDYLGLTVADMDKPGMSRLDALIETVHPEDAEKFSRALMNSLCSGESFALRYRLRRADGAYRWMSSRAEPMKDGSGRILQWYGLCHDIDDQMHIQEALRDRERDLLHLVNMVPIQIRRLTAEGEPVFFNKRLIDFFGLDVTDLDKKGTSRLTVAMQELIHPEDSNRLLEAVRHSIRSGEPYAMKYRMRRADGAYRWVEGRGEPVRNESGTIIQWYAISIDIDDQVRVEDALRERERFLWQLVETLPAMIDCAAPDGEPIYRSRQLRQFLGYDLERLDEIGKSRLEGTLDSGVHPDDLAGVKEKYAHSLSTGEPYARKHRLRRFDGEYRWVETRAAPMRKADGTIAQWNVICLDIDGEIRAQEELRQAQEKMLRASQAASLAELSASIAHEVNQPLAAIVANSHACERWLASKPANIERARKTVERIIRDANSAAGVVSRIRALFKQSSDARTSTTLESVIVEVRDLVAEEAARQRVHLNIDIEGGLPTVSIDRVQIQQVMLNLVRNAMDSMDAAGSDKALLVRVRRTSDAIQTEVIDCGQGIQHPDKIFEPFFTTKVSGMGMGLAICRSIVESHGGRLWAETNKPRGAKFIFTLPIEVKVTA